MITVEYCGYHTHNPDHDLIFRPSGTSSCLFLLLLSPMTFSLPDGSVQKVKPGACILYSPGTCQHYMADKEFLNSYVHFFCHESLLKEYKIRTDEIFYPDNREEVDWILKKIFQEFFQQMVQSERMLDAYIRQLLTLIYRGQICIGVPAEQHQNIYPELLALRGQMLGRCEQPWSVNQLCDILKIGKSQLYKYYEHFFHCSPKEELIQARLQKVKYLLSNEAVTIKQAAYESGFQNINHFNRIFKAQFGCTPGEYRSGLLG